MNMAMSGFKQYAGIGFVSAAPDTVGNWWQSLIGDVTRGTVNIIGARATPPAYQQNAQGVTIRTGAPVLATSTPGGGGGAFGQDGSNASGANLTAGNGMVSAGLSTNALVIGGGVLLAVLLLAKGRR